ncbi:CAAX protease self-immunity family protein [Cryptosporidium felis]|nr:CAAX protease self-immunity family protein [Cryptosporidium felis]
MVLYNKQLTNIILIGLLPCINTIFWLDFISNGWAAMYCMHLICMLLVPIACYGFGPLTVISKTFFDSKDHFSPSILFLIIVSTAILGTSTLFIFLQLSKMSLLFGVIDIEKIKTALCNQKIIENSNDLNFFTKFSIVYFSIINPLVEEVFWRLFIFSKLVDLNNYASTSTENNRYPHYELENEFAEFGFGRDHTRCFLENSGDRNKQNSALKGNKYFESIFCSLLYSSYHFFVLIKITSTIFSLLGTLLIALIGKILLSIKERYSILYSIYVHIGVDISVVMFVLLHRN